MVSGFARNPTLRFPMAFPIIDIFGILFDHPAQTGYDFGEFSVEIQVLFDLLRHRVI
jgi:hypothetical protein